MGRLTAFLVAPVSKPLLRPFQGALGFAVSTLAGAVRALFAGSANTGAWYSTSRAISTPWYQDSAGTTPVTAVEQPVGLALDRSLGLVRGPELVVNGSCTGTTGWSGLNLTNPGGVSMRVDTGAGGAEALLVNQTPVVAGKTYEVTFDLIAANNAGVLIVGNTRVLIPGPTVNSGPKKFIITPSSTQAAGMSFATNTPTAGYFIEVDNVSVKLLDGNHATQATAAARPVLSSRVNLLTKSENFSDVAWAKVLGVTTTSPNTLNFPNVTSGERFEFTTGNPAVANTSRTFGLELSGVGTISITANTSTGVGGASEVVVTLTATPTRYMVTVNYDAAPTGNERVFVIWRTGNTATQVTANKSQLDFGPTATRYQRVNTATDYDTAGFPSYLKFDGVDDSLSSATGGGGTAGFFFCAAVKVLGGAGSQRAILSDDNRAANAGYVLVVNGSNTFVFYAGNGVAFAAVNGTVPVIGVTYVITAWDDGVNLNLQTGSGAVTQVARPVVAAGTAGFSLGKGSSSATEFFNGNTYEYVYVRNSGLTAAQRLQAQRQVAAAAGIVL